MTQHLGLKETNEKSEISELEKEKKPITNFGLDAE